MPDIHGLFHSLEDEKESLFMSRSIFDSEQQKANYEYIDELKSQMVDSSVEKYVESFHRSIEDEILMIGSISLEHVQVSQSVACPKA